MKNDDRDPHTEDHERALRTALDIALESIRQEPRLPPRLEADESALAKLCGLRIGANGHRLTEVLEALRAVVLATPSSASPRFFNQLFGGRAPVATAAEMLTAITNTSMYTFKVGGPQILIEREVLRRLAGMVGFTDGEGSFSPGGSLSNLTAMMLARNQAVPGARQQGLEGPPCIVYTSEDGHYSTLKNAGVLGIGRGNVREIASDSRDRMRTDALAAAITADRAQGLRPVMISATSGTTILGAFDPLDEIADIATAEGIWLHVDAAFGGSALLSPRHRHLLAGVHRADSVTWDAHKMMGVPLTCSALLLRRRGQLAANLDEAATYLFQSDADDLNPGTRSIQCGRRNDALKLWAAWLHYGDQGWAARIERCFHLARYATECIEADSEMELFLPPQSVNVCFEVHGCSSEEICDRLDREGRMLIGHGTVHGRPAIRLVCVNPALREDHIDWVLEEIRRVARDVQADASAIA